MGKAGRFACIFVPMACTIGSLICLILVGMGGTNKSNGTLDNFYFFKADTSNFTSTPSIDIVKGTNLDNNLLSTDLGDVHLEDFYTVALWGYCSGKIDSSSGAMDFQYCSPPKMSFWFDPIRVWGLNNTSSSTSGSAFVQKVQTAVKAYGTVAKWMFVAYAVAFVATVVEFLLGFLAIFSRWGSFLTTIASSVSGAFLMLAAITSTALYAGMAASFNTALKPFHIHGSLGRPMLSVVWLAVAFSWAAGLFWLFSTCCCSGRSNDNGKGKGKKGMSVQHTPYTYERVASPYLNAPQQSGVAMRDLEHQEPKKSQAYEPFRHT